MGGRPPPPRDLTSLVLTTVADVLRSRSAGATSPAIAEPDVTADAEALMVEMIPSGEAIGALLRESLWALRLGVAFQERDEKENDNPEDHE